MKSASNPARVFALVAALVAAAVSPVRAQTDTGEIVITVVDASTHSPIVNSRVFLIGPTTASSLTTAAGVIRYTDVPTGIYRVRVAKQGYDAGTSSEFDVLASRSVEVRVALALNTGGLKVIGSVTARSNVSISSSDINDSSPVRRLSDSLTDALNKLAGVSVTQDSNDPNSAVTVSLRGHDESQTSTTLDGIPLAAAGSSANLRAIGTDLFSGSSVNFSSSAGSLGGGVNFRTLQPTQALQTRMAGTYGTYDRANYQIATTGSIGSLGIAAQHTWRGSNNPLTFQTFEDQSGLTYAHEGESTSLGDFLKVRYRLNDNRTSIAGTALSNNNDFHALCTRFVTLFPCGSGPGNYSFSRYGFAYGTVQSLIGSFATTVSGYTNSNVSNSDNLLRYIDGVPAPSSSTSNTTTRGVAYSSSIAEGQHTFSISGNTFSSITNSIPLAGAQFQTPFSFGISSSTYGFSDSIKSSDRITLSPRVSLATTTGVGTSVLGGFGATWRPQATDSFDGSVSFGSSQPQTNLNLSFSDPLGAQINCSAGSAIISGPGDTGGHQASFGVDAAWSHQFKSGATLSVDAYTQVQSGQLIQALIAEPIASTYFPPGYIQAVNAVYHQSTYCGVAAPNPTVYVSERVGGTRRVYQGMDVSGRFGLGRYVVVLPTYSINFAKLTAAGPRLLDGPSTSIVGAQLPGRPIHKGGLTLDALIPSSKTELLATAQYSGTNSFQNLGSYVTLAAGIAHDFGPGRLTVFENNVFNTYAGVFSSAQYAQPLALSNGGQLQTAAFPLTPRTISATYTVNVGGPRPASPLGAIAQASQRSAQLAQQQQQNIFRNIGTPLPPPPGADPLGLATARTSCDADAQKAAKPVLDELRGFVTAYEAKATLPALDSFDVTPHATTLDPTIPYYLELRPKLAFGPQAGNAPRPGGPGGGGPGSFGGEGRGGEGGGPGGGGPIIVQSQGAPQITDAQRQAFLNSPGFRAFRGVLGCAFVTIMTTPDAKAKGIVSTPRQPQTPQAQGSAPPAQGQPNRTAAGGGGLFYVPGVGIVSVRPPELPQGGGSVKQGGGGKPPDAAGGGTKP
jgi:hypothetical protein